MISKINIEVEDWNIYQSIFFARYFRDGHPCSLTCGIEWLERFVTKNNLLGWWNMVFKNNVYVDDIEGKWDFGDWVKEKLNGDIVRDFIVSHINENG